MRRLCKPLGSVSKFEKFIRQSQVVVQIGEFCKPVSQDNTDPQGQGIILTGPRDSGKSVRNMRVIRRQRGFHRGHRRTQCANMVVWRWGPMKVEL
jgi:hypothetical protein